MSTLNDFLLEHDRLRQDSLSNGVVYDDITLDDENIFDEDLQSDEQCTIVIVRVLTKRYIRMSITNLATTGNCRVERIGDIAIYWSYNTPVALVTGLRPDTDIKVYINSQKYSVTTSKQMTTKVYPHIVNELGVAGFNTTKVTEQELRGLIR